jgi:catechol 2,3-dioxygenase-like lactoylglutathione lyase family enzyme
MFEHGHIVYIQIPAADITASARFYERVLGWAVDPPESGFEAPGLIGQWVTDRPSTPEAGPVLWIHVNDVGRTLAEAEQAGAVLRQSPTPDGPRLLASFSDPAGNLVGIVAHGDREPVAPEDWAGASGPARQERAAPTSGPRISVMLIVPDADAAVTWYREALGAEVLWDLGGVAGLDVGGAPFFLHQTNPRNPAEDSPGRVGQTSVRIEVFVDDPDGFIERAVAAGAAQGSPITTHELPWGAHRQGGFQDPFGHKWSVGDTSPLRAGTR